MARLIFITGASRSGKSGFAQELAEGLAPDRTYIATCPRLEGDAELDRRILRHQQERAGRNWVTIEEPVDLVKHLNAITRGVVLIDCLTLWVNNLLWYAEQEGRAMDEMQVAASTRAFIDAVAGCRAGTVIAVSNEVGWSVVPENALARLYRDCVGRCNQLVAQAAEAACLMVCSIPVWIRGDSPLKQDCPE
ncbi:MAG: bifunctional adenosylcobinamide kinase/adenosylcobinamide-phosphate guanylyltransferase [Lentisphaerae bacterium]|nr:MAG: bifunctional adenosylcobinamide kinase/adenosylcobinamide-phosphate guanylyltransferase [Lentisphaerota bacterium]